MIALANGTKLGYKESLINVEGLCYTASENESGVGPGPYSVLRSAPIANVNCVQS